MQYHTTKAYSSKEYFEFESSSTNRLRRFAILAFLASILVGPVAVLSFAQRTPNIRLNDIIFLLLFYLFLLAILAHKVTFSVDKTVVIISSVFIAAQIISILANQTDLLRGLLSLKTFLAGIFLYFLALSIFHKEGDVDWLIFSLVLFATFISLFLLVRFAFTTSVVEVNKGLIRLGFGGSNYLAAFIVFFIPVSIGLIISQKDFRKRLFFVCCATLMIAALLITMSRGAMLSLAMGFMIVSPMLLRRRQAGLLAFFLVLVLMLIVVLFIVPTVYVERNVQSFAYRLANPDYTRIELMRESWQDFISSPIYGHGPFRPYRLSASGQETMPHNYPLQLLADLGILGGLSFLLLIVLFLRRSYTACMDIDPNRRVENVFLLCALIVTLIHSQFELTFTGQDYVYTFFLFNTIVTFRYLSAKNTNEDNIKDRVAQSTIKKDLLRS